LCLSFLKSDEEYDDTFLHIVGLSSESFTYFGVSIFFGVRDMFV